MHELLKLESPRLYVLTAPRCQGAHLVNQLTAQLALQGPVRVLDCGNAFDVYTIARQAARQPSGLDALQRIQVARAFTCHQVVALLAEQSMHAAPLLALDLLSTFEDENIPLAERRRLLQAALASLQRLALAAPVLVSVRPMAPACNAEFIERLLSCAAQVWRLEEPPPPQPAHLF